MDLGKVAGHKKTYSPGRLPWCFPCHSTALDAYSPLPATTRAAELTLSDAKDVSIIGGQHATVTNKARAPRRNVALRLNVVRKDLRSPQPFREGRTSWLPRTAD